MYKQNKNLAFFEDRFGKFSSSQSEAFNFKFTNMKVTIREAHFPRI